jgi:hypothetical protein
MSDKIEFVTVKAADPSGRVALYETHPDHVTKDNPTGEAFVAGENVVKVARTSTVEKKLREGELVETSTAPEKPVMAQRDSTLTGQAPKPATSSVHVENIGRPIPRKE